MDLPPPQFSVRLDHINVICDVALMHVESADEATRNAPMRRDFENHQVFGKASPASDDEMTMRS